MAQSRQRLDCHAHRDGRPSFEKERLRREEENPHRT